MTGLEGLSVFVHPSRVQFLSFVATASIPLLWLLQVTLQKTSLHGVSRSSRVIRLQALEMFYHHRVKQIIRHLQHHHMTFHFISTKYICSCQRVEFPSVPSQPNLLAVSCKMRHACPSLYYYQTRRRREHASFPEPERRQADVAGTMCPGHHSKAGERTANCGRMHHPPN